MVENRGSLTALRLSVTAALKRETTRLTAMTTVAAALAIPALGGQSGNGCFNGIYNGYCSAIGFVLMGTIPIGSCQSGPPYSSGNYYAYCLLGASGFGPLCGNNQMAGVSCS